MDASELSRRRGEEFIIGIDSVAVFKRLDEFRQFPGWVVPARQAVDIDGGPGLDVDTFDDRFGTLARLRSSLAVSAMTRNLPCREVRPVSVTRQETHFRRS